jgi:thiamine kinase-like enzyme
MRQPNKVLFNQKWAKNFVAKRLKKYWPNTKKIISLEIQVIKVFLGYLRFTLRYRVLFLDNLGKIKEKNIIVKAEREKKIKWPPRIGRVERDFLAAKFLTKNGLGSIVPHPLEFYKPLQAYLYEEVAGETLKNFIQNKNWRSDIFFKNIPATMRALKKIHAIKKKPAYADGDHKKAISDGIRGWLEIISKYYPAGFDRAEMIVLTLEKIQKKYHDLLFDRKKYSITHGDFQNDNVIIGPNNKVNFIDFADSKFFNPLDDLASFLIQAELHFKYERPKTYRQLAEKLKKITYAAYFGKKIKPQDELQIDFFAAKDVLRIITFVSFTQRTWKTIHDHSKMMDELLTFTENKIKNLEKKYL